jgi:ribosome-binding protein aMBF1 (putative translation factor)
MARTRDFAKVIQVKLAANPDLAEAIESESFDADVARKIYEARMAAGLTQKQLAERVNTQQSVISRIEDADYDRHSLVLLKRIARALGLKLRVEFYACSISQRPDIFQTYAIDWKPSGTWNVVFHQSSSSQG